jgi:multicomponent Na+:H+ antiporter subunit C
MFLNIPYIAVVVLALIGLAMVLFKRNLIKIFLGIVILESAVNLFLIALGYREGGIAPIYTNAPAGEEMVFSTVQALTLTSIVIGVATTAVMLTFAMVLWKKYGSIETNKIRRLKE